MKKNCGIVHNDDVRMTKVDDSKMCIMNWMRCDIWLLCAYELISFEAEASIQFVKEKCIGSWTRSMW